MDNIGPSQNMFNPADMGDGFSQYTVKGTSKQYALMNTFLKAWARSLRDIEKIYGSIALTTDKILKNTKGITNTPGGSRLGMGELPTFTAKEKLALGTIATGTVLGAMMPNTMTAITQRLSADTMAGISGMTARNLISGANKLVQGVTSPGSPTMATMAIGYQGGFLAGSTTSNRILSATGGLSALTGLPNEQVAGAFAGMSGMPFLRMGIQIRQPNGDLKPIDQIINSVWNFMYGGRKVTKAQAMMVYNPGSKAHYDVATIAGGDPTLFSAIAQGLVARAAKNDKPLTATDLNTAQGALDVLGVGKDSPFRSNFRNAAALNRNLQITAPGLEAGYNAALNTNATLTNGLSDMESAVRGVTYALGSLKGFLQTFPSSGNVGGTISGIISSVAQYALMGKVMGLGRFGKAAMAGAEAAGGARFNVGSNGVITDLEAGAGAAGGAKLLSKAGLLGKIAGMSKFGKLSLGSLALAGGTALLNKLLGSHVSDKTHSRISALGNIGGMAMTGAAIGSLFPGAGTLIGGLLGGGLGLLQSFGSLFGGQGGESGSMPSTPSNSGAVPGQSKLMNPLSGNHLITSEFGKRLDPVAVKNGRKASVRMHNGVDFACDPNTPVMAAADGTVEFVGFDKTGYGNYVIINHGSIKTLYGHLNKVFVRVGQDVSKRDIIALSGATGNVTGPHLHFEVRTGKTSASAQNPKNWLSGLKSFIGKTINKVKQFFGFSTKSTSSSKDKFNPSAFAKDIYGLSSPDLSALLSKTSNTGAPISYDDLVAAKGNSTNNFFKDTYYDASVKGTKTSNFLDYMNNKIDMVSGDKVGMAFGSRANLMKALYRHGFRGKGLQTAFAVALAESGGRVHAIGDTDKENYEWGPSMGPFQIRSLWDPKKYNEEYRDYHKLFNPDFNLSSAFIISNKGTYWKPWSTFTSGAFAKYLDDAQKAAKAAKIPSYDIGTARVPEDQLALVHKDEMIVPAKTADKIRRGTNAAGGTTNINVDMKVHIDQGDPSRVQLMLNEFKRQMKRELELKGMGMF